jgi:hypothetical protein
MQFLARLRAKNCIKIRFWCLRQSIFRIRLSKCFFLDRPKEIFRIDTKKDSILLETFLEWLG